MIEVIHKVHYYETDRMGITHHSNYIRWMEEARVALLNQWGCGYRRLEEDGIISPVIAVDCQYKHTTTFDDEVKISVKVEKYTGVRLMFRYHMVNIQTGDVVLTGTSSHCFLDQNNKPVILKKLYPEMDQLLREVADNLSEF